MRRSRIGQRPSDIKQRGAMMGLDEEHDETPPRSRPADEQNEPLRRSRPTFEQPRPPLRRSGTKKSAPMRGVFIVVLVIAAAAVGAVLASSGNIFSLSVDRVELQLGESLTAAGPGETIDVPYADGLICKRIIYKGVYRLFAPSSAVFMIEGVEQSANRYNENLVGLLAPEQQLDYRLVITGGEKQDLGSVAIRLTMTAADWIARSEQVSEAPAQVICLEKAIALEPDSQDARVALGRLYEGRKERAKAVQEYEAVMKINPDHAGALRSLVRLYEGDKTKTARLIQLYDRLARIDTKAADSIYFKAAELARTSGQAQSAIDMYRKALEVNRGHIAARQQLIKLYEARKEWNRAAGNTVVLLEYEPKNADLHLFLSQMYMNLNDFDAALKEAGQAARLRPADAAVLLHQGMLAEKAKKTKEAIEFYKQALKLDKKNHAACNNLAMLIEKEGNRKEAITWYKQAVALNPANIGYHINLADALEKNSQTKEAAEAYEALVARDKKNTKAWEALAVLQERAKNPQKALAAYQALSGLEPKNAVWLQKIAGLYEQLGNIAKARDTYKAVLTLNPKNAQARQKYVELSKKIVMQ